RFTASTTTLPASAAPCSFATSGTAWPGTVSTTASASFIASPMLCTGAPPGPSPPPSRAPQTTSYPAARHRLPSVPPTLPFPITAILMPAPNPCDPGLIPVPPFGAGSHAVISCQWLRSRRTPCPDSAAALLVTGFQDFLQLAEVLRDGSFDPWGRQPGGQPEDTRRWIKGHVVREPRPARYRLKQVADPGAEGTDLSPYRQALARLEYGDFETFLASAGDRAGLTVDSPYPYRPRRGLPGFLDGVVPLRHVFEVREEREDLLGRPVNRYRVRERFHGDLHRQLSSSRRAAVGSWAGRTTRSGICSLSARTLPVVTARSCLLPTPGTWRRSRMSAP